MTAASSARRLSVAAALTASLLVGLLSAPLAVLAGTPSWAVAAAELLPETVEAGGVAGYSTTIRNAGPSNIAHLSATVFFQQPYASAGSSEIVHPPSDYAKAPEFVAASVNGVALPNACGPITTAPVSCSFGSLGANDTATITVAYRTAGTQPAGVHGWWQSSGSGSTFCTAADNSHGDCLPIHLGPTIVSSNVNFGGEFVLKAGAVIDNAPSASSSDPQVAHVVAPARHIAVTVADGDALTIDPECPPAFAPCAPLGTTELHVGDGSTRYGLIQLVIEFDKSALRGVNLGKLTVIHIHDDLTTSHELPACPRRGPITGECAQAENLPGGGGRVTMWLAQNGYIKYH